MTRAVEDKTASKICCEAALDTLLQLLHPMAPHITEELWERRGHGQSLLDTDWPVLDEAKLAREQFLLVVQVDGKLRDRIEVESAWGEKEVRLAVLRESEGAGAPRRQGDAEVRVHPRTAGESGHSKGHAGMKRLQLSALFLLVVTLAGCGYSLVGRGSNLPPEVRRVQLMPLENATPRSQVDQILTRALSTELVNRKRFEVLSSAEGADAVLTGTVSSFTLSPVTFDAEGRATEYEIAIVVSVKFKQLAPETLLYENDSYLFRSSYEVQASELGFQDRETPAIEATAKDFAESLVTDLLEGF